MDEKGRMWVPFDEYETLRRLKLELQDKLDWAMRQLPLEYEND